MRKIWTYLSSVALTSEQEQEILSDGKAFVSSWTAHDNPLQADFQIHLHRILIFSVNEEVHMASGCSIDKLLRFVKDLEKKYSIELLNRLLVAASEQDGIFVFPASKIPELLENGKLSAQSLIYNTAVSNEMELAEWLQPLHSTWLKKYLTA